MAKPAVAILIALIGSTAASAQRTRTLIPRTKDDFGSGATIQTDWYSPGGIGGGVGLFVGHPNTLARSDRALIRCDLAPYLRTPIRDLPIQKATLTFRIEYFLGPDDQRRIEVSHLTYDALHLGGFDLVNRDAESVGTVAVRKGTATMLDYTLDVTRCVRDDLWKGARYATFRFRDVDAEAKGNPKMAPVGVVLHLHGSLPRLEIRETR